MALRGGEGAKVDPFWGAPVPHFPYYLAKRLLQGATRQFASPAIAQSLDNFGLSSSKAPL